MINLRSVLAKLAKLQVNPIFTFHTRGDELLAKEIRFPSGSSVEVSVRTSQGTQSFERLPPASTNCLEVKGVFACDASKLVESLYAAIQTKKFTSKKANVMVGMTWDKADLLREETLGSANEVDLTSSYMIEDPTVSRISFHALTYEMAASTGKTYSLHVTVRDRSMTVYISGDYTHLLPKIINVISPQHVLLSLSADDKQRLMANIGWLPRLVMGWVIRLNSKRQERVHSMFAFAGEERKITTATSLQLPTQTLGKISRAVGRSLFNQPENDETHVRSLSRVFSNKDEVLEALKRIVKLLDDFTPKVRFGDSLLTTEEARCLLSKEIENVVESYKVRGDSPFSDFSNYFGPNTHIIRGSLLRRLVFEHFGVGIVEELDAKDRNSSSFLQYLQGLGYNREKQPQDHSSESTPDYIKKERHLLAFFLQSYAKNQDASVEAIRKWYSNKAPSLSISGMCRDDASQVQTLNLPQQANLFIAGIMEEYGSDTVGTITLKKHTEGTVHLFARIVQPVYPENLLDIQERVLMDLGVQVP